MITRLTCLGLPVILLSSQDYPQKKTNKLPNDVLGGQYYTFDDFKKVKKIDSHVHLTEDIDTAFINQAKADNFRMLTINVYSSSGTPIEEQQDYAIKLVKAYPGLVAYATTFSLKNYNEPGWQSEVIAYLRNSFAKGAVAVKVWKNVGMQLRDKNNKLVFVDNARFDTIFNYLAINHIPLIGHLGEHKNSWLPLDKMTVKGNRDYAAAHSEEYMYLHPDRPSYEYYLKVRDHMLDKNPKLQFIGAHLGALEWSVAELGKTLDKYPNMAVDMAERVSHLQYQAKTNWQGVHDFFIKYQDRILYGTDMRHDAMDIVNEHITTPEGLRKHAHEVWLRHWRFFTTNQKMRVPKVEGEFYGLKLPRTVVDKIYYKNAQKWIPGVPK
ncbi:amidohydrolase family protein [Mucilaginibacter ginsenosidivorax]|uniref:Amidohydrolase family protein n=2 Tax=Mucilaginibacter ginsenosidivorax TaxID=862126 RepID=A0A5B8WC75_9SPHI|nr:amidohydrolase family protein [Mucilaginibacter ginsenosidivorax]